MTAVGMKVLGNCCWSHLLQKGILQWDQQGFMKKRRFLCRCYFYLNDCTCYCTYKFTYTVFIILTSYGNTDKVDMAHQAIMMLSRGCHKNYKFYLWNTAVAAVTILYSNSNIIIVVLPIILYVLKESVICTCRKFMYKVGGEKDFKNSSEK